VLRSTKNRSVRCKATPNFLKDWGSLFLSNKKADKNSLLLWQIVVGAIHESSLPKQKNA